MSVSGLLNIARDAIVGNQIAINITGVNIANVNTPGYTRQRAEFNATSNGKVASGTVDFGVKVENIARLYNRYLETQTVNQAQDVGYSAVKQETLGRIAGIFNESGSGGLSDALSQFWNSWENLSANPTSQVARYSVVSTASNLTSLFQEDSNTLATVQQEIQDNKISTVQDINALTAQIADLNKQILSMGRQDGSANNLLDTRAERLKDLSNKININYYENSDGTINVFLGGGKTLVGGDSSAPLTVTNGSIVLKDDPATALNGHITGGRLGAMIEMGKTTVSGYQDTLNQLADGIVQAVNDLHTVAWVGHDVIDNPPVAGLTNQYSRDIGAVNATGDFRGVTDKTYEIKITQSGDFGDSTSAYQIKNADGTWGAETLTDVSGVISLRDGVSLTFADPTKSLFAGDTFSVNAYPPGYRQGVGPVFFDDSLPGAKNMQISKAILADPHKIVVSATGNYGLIDGPIAAGNKYTGTVAAVGTFTGLTAMSYALKITADGAFGDGISAYQISTDGGKSWGDTTSTDLTQGGIITFGDGVSLTFPKFADATKPLVSGDIFYVNAYPKTDFSTARLMGTIKDSLAMDGGASTFSEFYASLVGRIGYDVQAADNSVARNAAVTNQLAAQRESASGVSMDEEVINLMKYQFAYSAAGKLAKAANDMLDVLMSLGK